MKTKLMILALALLTGVMMGQAPSDITNSDEEYGDQYLASVIRTQGMVSVENNALSYLEQGIQYSHEEKHYASLEALDKALALDPRLAEAHDYKAIAYMKLGRFIKALNAVNDAIECNPALAEAYNHRGIIHFYLQNGDEAMKDYDMAISLKNEYGTAYFNRGLLKLTLGDEKGALEDLSLADSYKCKDASNVINEFFAKK